MQHLVLTSSAASTCPLVLSQALFTKRRGLTNTSVSINSMCAVKLSCGTYLTQIQSRWHKQANIQSHRRWLPVVTLCLALLQGNAYNDFSVSNQRLKRLSRVNVHA